MSDILDERERDLRDLESMLGADDYVDEEANNEEGLKQQGPVKQPMRLEDDPADSALREEVNACCNSLGKLDINDGIYMIDRNCKIYLRELVRFLVNDKKRHLVRMQLNKLNIIKSDLIPLMVQYCDFNDGDSELFNLIIRLCTMLTMPTIVLFNDKIPGSDDPVQRQLYDDIHQQIGVYKESFANNEYVWTTLNVHLRHTNSKDEEHLNANLHFERLIILTRNILHIPVKAESNSWENNGDIHETLLGNMEKSGLLSTIITILNDSIKGSEYCFHLMEIVYYMLRDQNPKTIARAEPVKKKRTVVDRDDEDRKRYLEIRERNRLEREANNHMLKYSRFKQSAFVVHNVRGIGNRPLVMSKPIVNATSVIDDNKTLVKKNKNRKPLDHKTSMEISDQKKGSSPITYKLKVFCKQFVDKVYNETMLQMKQNLIQKRAQEDDESTYLWAIEFFTGFTRHLKLSVENISESLAVSTFHMINMLIDGYQEKIKMEKKNFHTLTTRLHLALRAYREILLLMKYVIQSEPSFKSKAESLMLRLFNERDYSNLILALFKNYSEPKHTLHYARDLIETTDVYLRLFEEFTKSQSEADTPIDKKVSLFVSSYANPDILEIYMSILLQYKLNDDSINGLILDFFERVSQVNMLMLCQASIFKLLFHIAEDTSRPASRRRSYLLCKQLCEFYGNLFNKQNWLIQELMYWKTHSDCLSIETQIDPPPEPEVVVPNDADDLFGGLAGDDMLPDDAEKLVEIPLSRLLSSDEEDNADDDDDEAAGNANKSDNSAKSNDNIRKDNDNYSDSNDDGSDHDELLDSEIPIESLFKSPHGSPIGSPAKSPIESPIESATKSPNESLIETTATKSPIRSSIENPIVNHSDKNDAVDNAISDGSQH